MSLISERYGGVGPAYVPLVLGRKKENEEETAGMTEGKREEEGHSIKTAQLGNSRGC